MVFRQKALETPWRDRKMAVGQENVVIIVGTWAGGGSLA